MHVCVFVLQKTAFRRIYCTCAVSFVSMCFVFSTIIIIVLCTFLFSKLIISFRLYIRFRCWVQQIFTAYRSLFFMCSIFFPSIIGCLFVCLFLSDVYHVTAWYLLCTNCTRFKHLQLRTRVVALANSIKWVQKYQNQQLSLKLMHARTICLSNSILMCIYFS